MHKTAIMDDDSGNLPPIGHVARNARGGMYEPGRNFSRLKWHEVVAQYRYLQSTQDNVTIRQLANFACVSFKSAQNAIRIFHEGDVTLTC